jgi:hypothetical protein
MATWTFSDGTVLHSGGRVSGAGQVAEMLRDRVDARWAVYVLPHPSEPIPVDPNSDYLLDALAFAIATAHHVEVDGDYERSDEDAPAHLRKALAQARFTSKHRAYGSVY